MEEKMKWLLDQAQSIGIKAKKVSANVIEVPEFEIYSSDGKKGCVLIISNPFIGWGGKLQRDKASEADVKMMKTLWVDEIGCELFDIGNVDADDDQQDTYRTNLRASIAANNPKKIYEGVSAEEMMELLKSFSKIDKDYAYIVVVISSHGAIVTEKWLKNETLRNSRPTAAKSKDSSRGKNNNAKASPWDGLEDLVTTQIEIPTIDVFFGEDCKPVLEKNIIELFYQDKSKELERIPKLFIFDYCRFSGHSKKIAFAEKRRYCKIGTLMSDTVTAYATHRSYVAYDSMNGSWLITAIKEVFSKYYKQRDVLDMLTIVNEKISCRLANCQDLFERSKIEKISMSIFESSLVKKFYLVDRSNVTESTDMPNEDD